ncbi:MAG: sugar ABC transporter substrate-binding protein [Ostreibacterium sp.]
MTMMKIIKQTLLVSAISVSVNGFAADKVLIGVDQPRNDTDFWTAFSQYIPKKANELDLKLFRTSSNNDAQKMIANTQQMLQSGVKAIILAPQDTAAAKTALDIAKKKGVAVVTVDTRPDAGEVYMVVRADNRAYGTNSCIVLGEKLGGKGRVVEFQGALNSINGRDRSEAFAECMKSKYPNIKVIEIPTNWKAEPAIAGLQTALAGSEVNGIYMQAGGAYLQSTLAFLRQNKLLVPAGQKGHIAIVSNDGIKSELDAIRKGEIDATISQPADGYAGWALYYAKAAANQKHFSVGSTDHDSVIIAPREGLLEDQIQAPVVTADGASIGELPTVQVDDTGLWGNK